MRYTYKLENLNCANCASKIENKIAQTDGYTNVSLNFATKKLSFTTAQAEPLRTIQKICDNIEDGVSVVAPELPKKFADNNACCNSKNNCCAGHNRKSDNCCAGHNSYSENSCNAHNHKSENCHCEKLSSKEKFEKILKDKASLITLFLPVIFTVSAVPAKIFLDEQFGFWLTLLLCIASVLLAGGNVFAKGIKNLLKFRFDEITLMTIAVFSAFCLGEFVEASMVMLLFAIGELLEEKAVDSSRRDIEKLAKIRADFATVVIGGVEKVVLAEEVTVGSEVVVKPYERVPLDGVVINGTTTFDMSALTGESVPLDIAKGSECMSGAINGSGLITIRTTKKFKDSTATRILNLVEDAASQKGKKEKLISRFASVYTPIVIIISLCVAVVPFLLGFGDFQVWLYRALSCLVAACPCAIVISVPLAYYSGIGAGSKMGVLIKGGKYIEALAKADAFVFDKTGTLTTGELSVNRVVAYSGYSEEEILSLCSACEKYSSHPVANAIKKKARGLSEYSLSDFKEKAGYGVSAVFKGKKLECGGSKILTAQQRKTADPNASVFLLCDGELIGEISVSDTVRKESESVVVQLKKLGLKKTYMLTGDRKMTAEKVKNELNIDCCIAELLPEGKLESMQKIKQGAKTVCFVGDGINDAPVLSASDCGIALGFGSEAAVEASDVVLTSGGIGALPKAVRQARRIIRTVKINIAFALSVKVAVIVLATVGIAPMWLAVAADTGVSVLCVLNSSKQLQK